MTSVVDTSVKHFHSGMANAPVLTGSAGSLISVLDACLVNGFDLKTATSLVVSGGVATLSFSGLHSATVDSVILIAGSSLPALNGEQKVTVSEAGVIKFATAQANGTATGTITFKMAPAGWLKPFSGTNLAAYKSADPESTGMFLRIDDTNSIMTRIVGYENMTTVSAGTGPFPTPEQMSGGGHWPKVMYESVFPIVWAIIGDGRTFYIHIAPYSGSYASSGGYSVGSLRGFGDMIALRPAGDAYVCALGYLSQSDANNYQQHGSFDNGQTSLIALPRGYSGLGGATLQSSAPYTGSPYSSSGMDSTLGSFPSLVDGSLRLSKRYITTLGLTSTPRCDVPGIYSIPQTGVGYVFPNRSVVEGTGPLAGRNLFGVTTSVNTATTLPGTDTVGLCLLDITGPWR